MTKLQPYPFERLSRLFGDAQAATLNLISLSIGEPKHATPGFITEELITHLHGLSNYPTTRGTVTLRAAIAHWLSGRFKLPDNSIDPERQVLPVNGTREALFAFAQCIIERHSEPLVLMPNPFYQIYEGAALLAGARPVFMNTTRETSFKPDFDAIDTDTWKHCQLVYICTPGNPTGAVMSVAELQHLIQLADEHDFVIASDECYSEIYRDENSPPPGLLQAATEMGRHDFRRCIVFHSLSKRSNAPGLRSGFVAGDAQLINHFFRYRTYHGCAMPPATQAASMTAWQDETHVVENRKLYREKFDAVIEILGPVLDCQLPDAGFYLWPRTPIEDTDFARRLFSNKNVTVLPGSYLSRETGHGNPGNHHVRLALVPPLQDCIEAATRIRELTETL